MAAKRGWVETRNFLPSAESVMQRPLRAQSLETYWVQVLPPQSCMHQHRAVLYHRWVHLIEIFQTLEANILNKAPDVTQAPGRDLAVCVPPPLPGMTMQRTNWLLGLESCLSSAPCGWRTGCRWAGSGAPEWLWCSSSPWCWLSPLCSSLWKPGKWNPTRTRHTRTAPGHPEPLAEP